MKPGIPKGDELPPFGAVKAFPYLTVYPRPSRQAPIALW